MSTRDTRTLDTPKKLLSTLLAEGITKVTLSYAGQGDEGSFTEVFESDTENDLDDELREPLERLGYELLEEHYGGWENNEGAQGSITIDTATGAVEIHHGWPTTTYEYEDLQVKLPMKRRAR
jgi:hypothetical protein